MNINLEIDSAAWALEAVAKIQQLSVDYADAMKEAVKSARYPREAFAALGHAGLMGMVTPKEYGGLGASVPEYCLVEEECARHGLVSGQTQVQGQCWLRDWGTPTQKSRYLPGLANGDLIFSESISEPGAASSLKNLDTTAERVGGGWVLRGQKCHINMGVESDLTLVYAMAPEGLTAFLVDTDTPGLRREHTHPVGMRYSPTANMYFDGVRVSADAVLGEVGQGFATFLSTFNVSRLGNASVLIGTARKALVDAVAYARHRQVGANAVTDFQGNQWTVAECHAALYAASLARDNAANLAKRGQEHALESSLAKYLAITSAEKVTGDVFALVGGHGLYDDRPFVQYMLDVKLLRVAGGSLEVLKNHIAKSVLKDELLKGLM